MQNKGFCKVANGLLLMVLSELKPQLMEIFIKRKPR
jgi:hypothetical protein